MSGPRMPPDRSMWVGRAKSPQCPGRVMPYRRPVPFEQRMPPGRGMARGRPPPFKKWMPPGQPPPSDEHRTPSGRGMPPGQPPPFEQMMPPGQPSPSDEDRAPSGRGMPRGQPPPFIKWMPPGQPPPSDEHRTPSGREMPPGQAPPFERMMPLGQPPPSDEHRTPSGRGMPRGQPPPFIKWMPPGQPLPSDEYWTPSGRGMPPGQAPPFEQMMPPRQPPPFEQRMPPGQPPLFERRKPPGQPPPFEQRMPPGRGMPWGRPIPGDQLILPRRPVPLEHRVLPGRVIPYGQPAWPEQQGSSPSQNMSRGSVHSGLVPYRLSSSTHPYNNNQRPRHVSDYTHLGVSPMGFYLVKLHPCFDETTSASLLSCLSHILENTTLFMPNWNGRTLSFIVDQHDVAQRLLNQDHLIGLGGGVQLRIDVEPEIPAIRLSEEIKKAITSVLRRLLEENDNTKADLTRFYMNPIFIEKRILCSLNLPCMLGHVVDVLFSLAPKLVTLILDDNSLTSLEEAGMVLGKFERLTGLSLARNKISSFTELCHLTALCLEALALRGNGCVVSLNRLDYEKKVHAVLPTVRVLDGQAVFSFFHWEVPKLPVWKPAYFPVNKGLEQLSVGFINRFRTLYDEMGRSNLAEVYHPEAVMSLTCDLTEASNSKWRLHDYLRYDRNLLDDANRAVGNSLPILFQGPQAILAALKTLPDTDHYLEHFTFDLIDLGGNAAQIIITGFFKEFNRVKFRVGGKPFKHFHRCLIVVYTGNEVQIVNDSLVIRHPNGSQLSQLALVRESRLKELMLPKLKGMKLNDEP